MREFAALFSILWRAVFLFPFALGCFVFVLAYLLLPIDLVLYSFFVSSWYWLTLPVWMASIYLLRILLASYFNDVCESWL